MNTIPSIFNEKQINHTVLGGTEKNQIVFFDVDCIILNRSSSVSKNRLFSNLLSKGFSQIISVGEHSESYSLDLLSRQYPQIKFIVTQEENLSSGDFINLGMAESNSPYVLVITDDLCSEDFIFSQKMVDEFIKENCFCVCPKLNSSKLKNLPVKFSPGVSKSFFSIESELNVSDKDLTFYSSDFAGFYNREKFINLGGYDYTIQNSFWQKLDLFFRSWLWGEKTVISSLFVLNYTSAPPEENRGADFSYTRFYVKNLLSVYQNDHAYIPRTSFFAFAATSSCGFSYALKLFNEARRWTEQNKYRFKIDAKFLIENWHSFQMEKNNEA